MNKQNQENSTDYSTRQWLKQLPQIVTIGFTFPQEVKKLNLLNP